MGSGPNAIVCAYDAMIRGTAVSAIESGDFELVSAVSTAPDLLFLLGEGPVIVVVLDNELPGQLGVDWIGEIHGLAPDAALILLTNDQTDVLYERAMAAGAFGIVYKTQMSELHGALTRAHGWLTDPEQHKPGERRSGDDRRFEQDWTKVTQQRRSDSDRRHDDEGPPDISPPAPV